jgi:signal peptidase II
LKLVQPPQLVLSAKRALKRDKKRIMNYELRIKNILFKYKTALILSFAVFILDRILKFLAINNKIFFYKNTGTAFSLPMPENFKNYFLFLLFFINLFLIYLAIKYLIKNNLYYFSAFFCIFLGAFSNLLDRLKYDFVIDYFNYYFFYNNLADVLICVGVGILVWKIIRK